MSKEAYYFSHDSNARHDPKITAMRGVYGSEGYAWFFMFIEMMRETDGYKLDMQSKYAFNAYAMQMHSNSDAIASFVHDCINEFELFSSDEVTFWSESLLRRMDKAHERSKKAAESANARWKKTQNNANASDDNANASKTDAIKESKEKEIKGKKLKEINKELYGDFVQMTPDQHDSLINDLGTDVTQKYIQSIDDWFAQDEKRLKKYSDHSRMVRTWKRNDDLKGNQQAFNKTPPKSKGTQPTEIEQYYARLKKEEQENEAV